MPDFCDRAAAQTALHTASALQAAASRPKGRGPVYVDGKALCRVCGGEINTARVKALLDVETCIECAREAE